LIVDLYELHFGELFEVLHERLRDGVQRAVRLAIAFEIHMRDAVGVFDLAVAVETVQDERETLIALHVAGTFEEFIEHRADEILRGWDESLHSHFVRQLPVDEAVVIGEIDIDFNEQRCARA